VGRKWKEKLKEGERKKKQEKNKKKKKKKKAAPKATNRQAANLLMHHSQNYSGVEKSLSRTPTRTIVVEE
jgi:hypothetical protein